VRGIRLEDRLLIAGETRGGKTTLAEYIVAALQPVRVIAFDPKGDLKLGVIPVTRADQLPEAIRAPVCHFIPSSFERDELERACQIVWETPGPYLWWVDDANEVSGPNWCPLGLRLAVTQGGAKGKMVLATVQRLAETHPSLRSQATHIIVFVPAPILLDLKTIAGHLHTEAETLKAMLEGLEAKHGPYSHLWYCKDGKELRRCAPLPTGEHRAPQRRAPSRRSSQESTPSAPGAGQAGSLTCEESDSASGLS
jgi:hypothetical protein